MLAVERVGKSSKFCNIVCVNRRGGDWLDQSNYDKRFHFRKAEIQAQNELDILIVYGSLWFGHQREVTTGIH